jgi:hypothetical protein
VPLDPSSRLFYRHDVFEDVQVQANNLASSLHVTSEANANLTRTHNDLLRRHHALVHCGFSTIMHIATLGWLGVKGLSLSRIKEIPLCGSCQYGKGHKRNPGTKTEVPNPAT